jgi:hypothetical protein
VRCSITSYCCLRSCSVLPLPSPPGSTALLCAATCQRKCLSFSIARLLVCDAPHSAVAVASFSHADTFVTSNPFLTSRTRSPFQTAPEPSAAGSSPLLLLPPYTNTVQKAGSEGELEQACSQVLLLLPQLRRWLWLRLLLTKHGQHLVSA